MLSLEDVSVNQKKKKKIQSQVFGGSYNLGTF